MKICISETTSALMTSESLPKLGPRTSNASSTTVLACSAKERPKSAPLL
jgi:hypothetical protein